VLGDIKCKIFDIPLKGLSDFQSSVNITNLIQPKYLFLVLFLHYIDITQFLRANS